VAAGHDQELRHFISESGWDLAEIEQVLWEKADAMLGGDDAFLIIDDTALPKKGDASVGVPKDITFQPKWRIALEQVRRLNKAGIRFGTVLADAGYGICASFRRALSEEKLLWAVGIVSEQKFYPTHACAELPRASTTGPAPKRSVPTHPRKNAQQIIAHCGESAWRRITWRKGTKGALSAEFIAVRVRTADGPESWDRVHLPGDEAWLVAERRHNGEVKYHLTNHPPKTSLKTLASAIKARWSCEQAHQQLKEELGLENEEGRTWRGLSAHALMTMIAFAFLQHERLRENKSAA